MLNRLRPSFFMILLSLTLVYSVIQVLAQVTSLNEIHTTDIRSYDVEWSPDGELIAVASDEGIHLFDAQLTELSLLQKHIDNKVISVAWNQSGTLIASGGGPSDSTIIIWQRNLSDNTFTFHHVLNMEEGSVSVMAWSPDGRYLASYGIYQPSGFNGLVAELYVWDTSDWTPIIVPEYQYAFPLFELDWSSDSEHLIGAGSVRCKHDCEKLDEGVFVLSFDESGNLFLDNIMSLFPIPNGINWSAESNIFVVSQQGQLEIFHSMSHEYVTQNPPSDVYIGRTIHWSPDGDFIVGITDDEIHIYSLSGTTLTTISASDVIEISWNPDNRHFVTITRNGVIKTWTFDRISCDENVCDPVTDK